MTLYTRKKILLIHSQQPSNQYSGGATGVGDSEQHWMRLLAEEVYNLVKDLGHDVRLGPLGHSYRDNVNWVQRSENRDAALLISFHSNATATAGDASVGIGVYHSAASTKGRAFAQALVPFLSPVAATGKAYTGTLYVSEITETTPPALLVEHEFHDHDDSRPGGADWIRDPKNRTAIAKAYRAYLIDQFGQSGTVTPVPPVVQSKERMFRFGAYNAQLARFGGGPASADVAFLKKVLKPSLCALVEIDEGARVEIGQALGWEYWTLGTMAMAWNETWSNGPIIKHSLGTAYHGIVGSKMTDKASGLSLHAFATHIRPNDAFPHSWSDEARTKAKLGDLRDCLKVVPSGPVVIGGDFSTGAARDVLVANGFTLATPYVDTYDKAGIQRLDMVAVRGLARRTGGSVHATAASDHHGLLANLTLEGNLS